MLTLTLSKSKEDVLLTDPDGIAIGRIMVTQIRGKQVRVGFDLDPEYGIARIPSEANDEQDD